LLKEMFPKIKLAEINDVVKISGDNVADAMDMLLTATFLQEDIQSSEEGEDDTEGEWTVIQRLDQVKLEEKSAKQEKLLLSKGVDGFAVDDDYRSPRKDDRRRRESRATSSKSSSKVSSPMIGVFNEGYPRQNAWHKMGKDIDFLVDNLTLPRTTVSRHYHANNASIGFAIHSIVYEEETDKEANPDMDSLEYELARNLAAEYKELDYQDLLHLVRLSQEGGIAAVNLAPYLQWAVQHSNSRQSATQSREPRSPNLNQEQSSWAAAKSSSLKSKKIPQQKNLPKPPRRDQSELEMEYDLAIWRAAQASQNAQDHHRRGRSKREHLSAATYYAAESRTENKRAHDLATQLADIKASQQSRSDFLDLHGIGAADAERIVTEKVNEWWTLLRTGREGEVKPRYEIVTGKGLHSQSRKAVLGPIVSRMLLRQGWRFSVESGRIFVTGRIY
jgi:hypothetical protein